MTYRLSIDGFVRKLRGMDKEIEGAVVRGFQAAGLVLAAEVPQQIRKTEPHPAVDTGALGNSVQYTLLPDGCEVAVTAPHAAPIENGTRPFWPPSKPLEEWVLRKGLADSPKEAKRIAFLVRKKIAEQGIAPRRYFRKSWIASRRRMHAEVRRELKLLGYGKVRVRSTKSFDD